jgi:hypothetical protein
MNYDRFLDIYLCDSHNADGKECTLGADGYWYDNADIGYMAYQKKHQGKKLGRVRDFGKTHISKVDLGSLTIDLNGGRKFQEADLFAGARQVAQVAASRYYYCFLDIQYVNGSTGDSKRPIPQLQLVMDWICDINVTSKLQISGHGSGKADDSIFCGSGKATAEQLATCLTLNGLRKGNAKRNTFTRKLNATWRPDREADNCHVCKTRFKSGFFSSNKHHCRSCGEVVCEKCSKGRYLLEEAVTKNGMQRNAGKVRVCDNCVNEFLGSGWDKQQPGQNSEKGLRQINLLMCCGAAAIGNQSRGGFMGRRYAQDSSIGEFAEKSFASKFVKGLQGKNIHHVRVAAMNQVVSVGLSGASAEIIQAPRLGGTESRSIDTDGIYAKIYGSDKDYWDKSVEVYYNANVKQKPIFKEDRERQKYSKAQEDLKAKLPNIKVSPDGRSLYFGLDDNSDLQRILVSRYLKLWTFSQGWSTVRKNIIAGNLLWALSDESYARDRAADLRAGNRMGRSFATVHARMPHITNPIGFSFVLTPPPGLGGRFEEHPGPNGDPVIKLVGGVKRLAWKELKVIEIS